jgi:Ca2+/Na+ antiporter
LPHLVRFALYTLLRHLHDSQAEAAVHSHTGVKAARTVGALELLSRSGGGEPPAGGAAGSELADVGGGGKGSACGMGQYIGRCEIGNAAGCLERVYFRMPDYCLLLTEVSKQELLWDVDRETPGKRLQELFERSDELAREMVHQQRLARSPAWQQVMRHKPVADNLVLMLALTQNCVIVLRYSWTPDEAQHLDHLMLWENVANRAMGSLQLCACVLVFCIYAIDRAPLRVWRGFRQATGRGAEEILSLPLSRWHASWFFILPYYAMADAQMALLACLFFASVLGLLHSPLWFSVHLLDIVNKSTDLQNVLKAVTLNGRSIAMTALFGATIIYLFAVVGFASAADVFVLGNYPDEDVPMCTSLFSCFLNALNEGLRSGDIGSFMEPAAETDLAGYAFRFAYQLSFWAIVITVLLNIIFGARLRAGRQRGNEAHPEETAPAGPCCCFTAGPAAVSSVACSMPACRRGCGRRPGLPLSWGSRLGWWRDGDWPAVPGGGTAPAGQSSPTLPPVHTRRPH